MTALRTREDTEVKQNPGQARTAGTTTPIRRGSKAKVAVAFLTFMLLGATSATLGAVLPALRVQYGLALGGGSGAVSAYNLGALAAIVVCGAGERVLRPRPTIVALLTMFALGCGGAGSAPQWPLFVGCLALAGCGFGGLVLYLNTAFAKGFGERSVLMLNLLNASFGVGAFLGPVIVGMIAGTNVRLMLLAVGVIAVFCWPVQYCGMLLPSPKIDKERRNPFTVDALSCVAPFALVGFLYAGLETSIGAWESTHLVWIGWPIAAAAELTALYWAGLSLGRFVIPAVVGMTAPWKIVVVALVAATTLLVAAVLPNIAPFAYAAAGFALGPVLPTTLAWMATTVPAAQSANAIVLTACMAANAAYPAVVGTFATANTPTLIPLFLTGAAAACLLAAFLARPPAAVR
jgi:FHS family glucose/mannose:H+ symporter-like MFS transporter